MAVAFDAVGPSSSGTQSATSPLTWTHVCGGSATLLLVGISVDAGSNDSGITASATYNGVSMTSLLRWQSGGSGHTVGFVQVFYLFSPATGSHSVSVSLTGSGFDGITGGSVSFTGAATLGTAVHSDSNSTSPTSGSVAVGTAGSANMVAAFLTNGSDTTAFTAGTSRFINNSGVGFSGGASFSAGATAAGTGGSVTISWTQGADFYAAVGVEVQAAAVQGDGGSAAWQRPWAPGMTQAFGPSQPWDQPAAFSIDPQPALTVNAGVATVGVTATHASGSRYITGISGSGALSYFIDNAGSPRLVWGDALWAWPGNAGRWNGGNWQADFDTLLSNRSAQGFTVVYCKPIGTTQSSNLDDFGKTFDSLYPFQGGSPSTGVSGALPSTGLTEAFWQRIDYMLNSALAQGITVFLNVTGYGSDWSSASVGGTAWGATVTAAEAQSYGTSLGTRYQSQENLVWMVEDDYFGTDDTKLDSLLTGIRSTGDTHLIAIENMPESTSRFTLDSSPSTNAWGNSNAQFNFTYSYNQEYYGIERAYAESSPICVIQGDGYFYQGGNAYFATYDRSFRQAAWWSLASGARGKVNGSESVWQWQSTALAASGTDWFYAHNSKNIRLLVESLPGWHQLTPDTSSVLVTGGRGTRASPFSSGGGGGQYNPAFTSAYVAASRTPDGGSGSSLALLYLPNATTITIDQTKMAAGYAAYWVDPFTAAITSTATGSTYNSTAKGSNSQGDPDWVLVLTTSSLGSVNAATTAAISTVVAPQPSVAVTANAGVATVSATSVAPAHAAAAQPVAATALAAVTQPSTAATAQPPPATVLATVTQPSTAATVNSAVATVLAVAPAPVPAATVAPAVAIVNVTALAAAVTTSGGTNAPAAVAAVTAVASAPQAAISALAGVAAVSAAVTAPATAVTAAAAAPAASATVTAPVAAAAAQPAAAPVSAVALAPAHAATAQPPASVVRAAAPAASAAVSGNTSANAGVAAVSAAVTQAVPAATAAPPAAASAATALAPVPGRTPGTPSSGAAAMAPSTAIVVHAGVAAVSAAAPQALASAAANIVKGYSSATSVTEPMMSTTAPVTRPSQATGTSVTSPASSQGGVS